MTYKVNVNTSIDYPDILIPVLIDPKINSNSFLQISSLIRSYSSQPFQGREGMGAPVSKNVFKPQRIKVQPAAA